MTWLEAEEKRIRKRVRDYMLGFFERFRRYDVFRDYFNDLEDIVQDVIRTLKNTNWGKAGRYI